MTAFWSALVTPGLAPPAAQPQIELTTISVVPGMARAASTSAAALSGVTPHCESSSHIGRTASGSYKGCILNPPSYSCALCGALAKHPFLLVPRRDHKSLISITMRATLGYFILWNRVIKGANRLPAALGCEFVTRIPLFFPSPTGFALPERLITRRPAGIKQKNRWGTKRHEGRFKLHHYRLVRLGSTHYSFFPIDRSITQQPATCGLGPPVPGCPDCRSRPASPLHWKRPAA